MSGELNGDHININKTVANTWRQPFFFCTVIQMQSKSDGRNVDFEMLLTMRPAPVLFALAVNNASCKTTR